MFVEEIIIELNPEESVRVSKQRTRSKDMLNIIIRLLKDPVHEHRYAEIIESRGASQYTCV